MGQWIQGSLDPEADCTNFFAQLKCPGSSDKTVMQTAHNHVLISLLNAFGINDQTIGSEDFVGPVAGILA